MKADRGIAAFIVLLFYIPSCFGKYSTCRVEKTLKDSADFSDLRPVLSFNSADFHLYG